MCTCAPDNNNQEEYHTAFSEFETTIPEDWRTSTRYYEDFAPPIVSTPRRIQDYQRTPRTRVRNTSRRDLSTGVAIVPRRIDYDAVLDVEEIHEEEVARETLQRLQSPTRPPLISESGVPGTYRLRRTRATQYPMEKRQYLPRMVKATPCGKCLRI